MHTISSILNSFAFPCYHLSMTWIFKKLLKTETWRSSLNCPLDCSYPNPRENPIDSLSKYIMICPQVFHFHYCRLGPGYCHLFPRFWSSQTSFPTSSHSTLYSAVTESILKSELDHITLLPTPSLPLHIHMHWKSFSVWSITGKEVTSERKYKAAYSFFYSFFYFATCVCACVCMYIYLGLTKKCRQQLIYICTALFLITDSQPAVCKPAAHVQTSCTDFTAPNNEAPTCLSHFILSLSSFASSSQPQ